MIVFMKGLCVEGLTRQIACSMKTREPKTMARDRCVSPERYSSYVYTWIDAPLNAHRFSLCGWLGRQTCVQPLLNSSPSRLSVFFRMTQMQSWEVGTLTVLSSGIMWHWQMVGNSLVRASHTRGSHRAYPSCCWALRGKCGPWTRIGLWFTT